MTLNPIPGPYGTTTTRPRRDPIPGDAPPGAISRAFALAMGQILLSLVGLVVTLADSDDLADSLFSADLAGSHTSAVLVATVVPVASFLIGTAVWGWLAVRMRDGRLWARMTMAGFCVLGVGGALFSLASGEPATIVLGVLGAVLAGATLRYLFAAGTDAWFLPADA